MNDLQNVYVVETAAAVVLICIAIAIRVLS